VALIEMLFSTSLVALILSPRHLVIQNTKVEQTVTLIRDNITGRTRPRNNTC